MKTYKGMLLVAKPNDCLF